MSGASKPKRTSCLLDVSAVSYLTPNMIRVTLTGPEIGEMENGCEGANCKIMLPEPGQSREQFSGQLRDGPRPTVRTYTVRFMRRDANEMDIDFVDHGDAGPASAWARAATPGAFCGFAGPGPVKIASFYADRYLVVADMSALPVAAATLEAMPRGAKGHAIFEITDADDWQDIDAPFGVKQHWIVNAHPHRPTGEVVKLARQLAVGQGRLQTCIAGESSMIKELRQFLHNELGVPREDTYISGYWKIGLIEDEHQKMKRAELA
ncbi:MAG: siderophore-interacting protein [Pseudomonadota bacterium]